LQVGNGATGSLGTGSVTDSGTLVFALTSASTVGNAISGSGSLSQTGSGTVTLTGSNSYGTTSISSGDTLQIGNGSSSGTLGTGTVTDSGNLTFNLSGGSIGTDGTVTSPTVVSNTINGGGTVTQAGSGLLKLTGNNGFSGGSTISSGYFLMGGASALGTGNISISSGALLMLPANATITNTFTLAGTLAPTVNALGDTLSGLLTISGSLAQLGLANESGNAVNFYIGNGTTGGLAGSGTLTDVMKVSGGTLHLNDVSNSSNFSGTFIFNPSDANEDVIADSVNAFGNSSATVQIGSGVGSSAVINASTSQVAALTVSSSGILQLVSGSTWAGNISIASATTLTLQDAAGNGTVSGQITGLGGISLTNNGGTILTFSNGSNNYSGGTSLNGLTLRVNATNATSPNSLMTFGGGTLDLSTDGFSTAVGGISGNGTISLGSHALITNDSNPDTYSGTITGSGGSLTMAGTSTLTINNTNNSYTGGTTVASGTLSVTSSGVLGSTSSTITLGNGSANASLIDTDNSSDSFSNPFTIAGTGTDTIQYNGTGTFGLSGAINGSGNGVGKLTITALNNNITKNISNNIGATTNEALASLTLSGGTGGTDNFTGTIIKTSGNQTYNDAMTISSSATAFTTTGTGNMTVNGQISWTGTNLLTLTSGNDIILASNGLNPIINATGGGSLTLIAGDTSGTAIQLNGGVNLTGGTVSTNGNLIISDTSPSTLITPAAAVGGTSIGGAINVNSFNITEGQWIESYASGLPNFAVNYNFQINTGNGYSANVEFLRAAGTSSGAYLLTDIYGFEGIGSNSTTLADSYKLAQSFSAAGTSTWNGGLGFEPIANLSNHQFSGGLDGQGFTIDSLYINRSTASFVGPIDFANLGSNLIQNIGLTNVNISGAATSFDTNVGGLVVQLNGGTVQNVYTTGTVTDLGTACNNSCSAGGVIASIVIGTLTSSFSNANVSGGVASVGGLVGFNADTISNSYSTGSVSGALNNVGGLLGFNNPGTGATVTNSYSTGHVTAAFGFGGLVGYNGQIVTNSFWDINTSGTSTGIGGGNSSATLYGGSFDGSTGVNLSSLATYTARGWTSGTTIAAAPASNSIPWAIISGSSYPYLTGIYGTASSPRAISGYATSSGSALAGATVTLATNGSNITTSNNPYTISYSTTKTGSSNGFYYFLESNGVIADTNSVVSYLTSGGNGSAITVAAGSGASSLGLNIATGTVSVGDNNTNSSTFNNTYLLANSTQGSLGSANLLYSGSGSSLSLTSGTSFRTNNSNITYTIDGSLTAPGGGTLSFAGPVTVNNAGAAISSAASQTYSGTVTLSSNGVFTDTNSSSGISFAAIAGGTNGLTLNVAGSGANSSSISGIFNGTTGGNTLNLNTSSGTGTLILTGANTYAGTTTISAGTLQVGNGATGSLGTGSVTDSGTLVFALTSASTVGNAISGSGSLSQTGSGTVTLTGSNSYGTTSISSGDTLQIGNGSSSGTLGTGTVTDSGNLTFNLSGGSIGTDGTVTSPTVVSNTINGGGTVTQAGSGLLKLTGNNGFSGGSTISSGYFLMGGASALGTGNISISSGALLMLPANATITNTFTLAGTLAPTVNALSDTLSGLLTINGSLAQLGLANESGNATNFYIGNGTTGGLAGSGTLTDVMKVSGGTLHLNDVSSSSNFSGTFIFNPSDANENVIADSINAFGNSSATVQIGSGVGSSAVINAGTSQVAALTVSSSGILQLTSGSTWAGNISIASATTLTLQDAAGNGTVSGQITGLGGISLSNNGGTILTFSNGSNNYSGGTSLNGLTLRVNATNATSPNSLITFGGGTLDLSTNGFSTTVSGISGSGTISLGNRTLTTDDSGSDTFSGSITGSGGSLTMAGAGTLTLSGSNSYSGTTTISAGTIADGVANALPIATTLSDSGTLDLAGFAQEVGSVTGSGTVTDSAASAVFNINNASSDSFGGNLTGSLALTKSAAGTLTLSGSNSYSGATTISAGKIAESVANALPNATTLTDSGILDLAGFAQGVSSVTGSGTVTDSGASAVFNVNNASSDSFAGNLTGSLALTKSGAGTLVLGSANTYTGLTIISAGTLQQGIANALPDTGVTVSGGATLDLNSLALSVGSLAGSGNISIGTATLTTGNDNTNTTFSGIVSGSTGSIIKQGTGNFTLSNINNSYSGSTSITNGILTQGSATAIPSTSNLILGSSGTYGIGFSETLAGLSGTGNINVSSGITLTINSNTSNTYSGALSGSGNIIKDGTGTLTLSGANNYSGNTTVQCTTSLSCGGILNISGNSTLGNITIASGSTLQISGASITSPQLSLSGNGVGGNGAVVASGSAALNGNMTLAADSTISTNSAADSLTVSGTIDGAQALSLIGSGSMTISGAVGSHTPLTSLSSNTGTTFINGSSVTTNGAQTYNGAVSTANGIAFNASGVNINGSTITSNGSQTYNAPVVIGADVTLTSSANISLVNGVSGSHNLSLVGSSGNNTFTLNGALNTNSINVTGSGVGNNTLSIQNSNNQTWSISGVSTGNIAGAGTGISFGNIQNITGGSGTNTFQFSNGDNIGILNGGSGTGNTLNYSAYTSPVNVTLTGSSSGYSQDVASFTAIQNLVSNGVGTITINNGAKINQLHVSGSGIGFVNDPISFNGFNMFNSIGETKVYIDVSVPFNESTNVATFGSYTMTFSNVSGVTLAFPNTATTSTVSLVAAAATPSIPVVFISNNTSSSESSSSGSSSTSSSSSSNSVSSSGSNSTSDSSSDSSSSSDNSTSSGSSSDNSTTSDTSSSDSSSQGTPSIQATPAEANLQNTLAASTAVGNTISTISNNQTSITNKSANTSKVSTNCS